MTALLAKGYLLVLVNVVDYGTPFIRMIMLSHRLSLRELGIASALVATYSTFELMTDFNLYRFVFSTPRQRYEEALASAHALSIARGATVGSVAVAASPLVAALLRLQADWIDFALLGAVIFIRSMEHLGPRVAERDYRYGVQFQVSLIANALSLTALATALYFAPTGKAILVSLFVQAIAAVIASRARAGTPYRTNFRSPLFQAAFRFGYPLMFNGFGVGASNQGDRFIVGGLLGLSTLGVYSIATLVTTVPMNMIARMDSTFLLAALYNGSNLSSAIHDARLKLAASLLPLVSAFYALGILTLMNIVVPLVFGQRFFLSREAVALLALAAFFRLARADPFTALMLNQGRTRRLALMNVSSASALLFEAGLILAYLSFESALMGRLLGELVATVVTLFLARRQFSVAFRDYVVSMGVGCGLLGCSIVLSFMTPVGQQPLTSLAALLGLGALCGASAARTAPRLFHAGFPGHGLYFGHRKV